MYNLSDEDGVLCSYAQKEDAEAMKEFLVERYMEWEFRSNENVYEEISKEQLKEILADTRKMFEETILVAETRSELSREQMVDFVNKEYANDLTVE